MLANVSRVECVNQIKLETISSQAFSLFLMAGLKEIGQLLLSLFFSGSNEVEVQNVFTTIIP